MTRALTLAGYLLLATWGLILELVARRRGRPATFEQALTLAVRGRAGRLVLLTGWLWLGWHLFVRVDW